MIKILRLDVAHAVDNGKYIPQEGHYPNGSKDQRT